MTSRQTARDALREANHHATAAEMGNYPITMALVGIGYALLAITDAIHQQTSLIAEIAELGQLDDPVIVEDVATTGDRL